MNIKYERDVKVGAIRITVSFYNGRSNGKRYVVGCKSDIVCPFSVVVVDNRNDALMHYNNITDILREDKDDYEKIHDIHLYKREHRVFA